MVAGLVPAIVFDVLNLTLVVSRMVTPLPQ
jgi:hypothetical protein